MIRKVAMLATGGEDGGRCKHTLNAPTTRTDMSFLAKPGDVADWRMVAIYGAATDAGLIDALPGTAEQLAAHCGPP